jgi:hypothetical protein
MKLTEIKDIQSLTSAQSTTLKGGARDTRSGTSTTSSNIRTDGTTAK